MTMSTANVGLVAATGVASRRIAFVVAAILAIAAFQPGLVALLTIMPPPVMASALLFTAVFIMISGVQIISTRVLDSRRTLVIGMGMMTFFVVSMFPGVFPACRSGRSRWLNSPLVLATLVALGLNLMFRLGIRRKVTMSVDPATRRTIGGREFRRAQRGDLGRAPRRRHPRGIRRAAGSRGDRRVLPAGGTDRIEIGYDEFDIDVTLTYPGYPLELTGGSAHA